MNVEVCNGKYTVVLPEKPGEKLIALRYGEKWRDCVGDNLIYYLASELNEAREKIKRIEENAAQKGTDRDLNT